jgi:hypothetical protein
VLVFHEAQRRATTVRERRSAIRGLGSSKSPTAEVLVRGMLEHGDADPWIRLQLRLAAEQLLRDLPGEKTPALAAALASSVEQETDPVLLRLRPPELPPPPATKTAPRAK